MFSHYIMRCGYGSVLLAFLFALQPTIASADHSWGNYHWARSSNPISLTLGDNVSGTWDSALVVATSDWNVSAVLQISIVAGGTTPRRCSATAGTRRIEVCNSTYGQTGWLGVASISVSGSHITSGTVRLNDTYFNTSQYNTPAWRALVTCQEVGHTFGLDHQDEVFNNPNLGTCMDYTNQPASNQHPNAHDYEELSDIYAHLDSSAPPGLASSAPVPASVPAAMNSLLLEGPGQWGRVTSHYSNGNPRTYELDFGRGNKIITHVFWVPGAAAEEHD